MKCENCNNEHDGSYCSGRFCSEKCAKSFSTKLKRKEINKKVSDKLKGRSTWNKILFTILCPICHDEFRPKRRKQIYSNIG